MSMLKKLLDKASHQEGKTSSVNADKVIHVQKYTQSHSFKGYKRFHVSYYGYKLAEEGLAKFKASGQQLEGAEITLAFVKRSDAHFVDVQVNNCLLGSVTMWTDNEVLDYFKNKFCTGKVTKAHIRIEYETILSKDKKGKIVQSEREKINLFLKAEE